MADTFDPEDRDSVEAFVEEHRDDLAPIHHTRIGHKTEHREIRPGDVLANDRYVKVVVDLTEDNTICYYVGDGAYMTYPPEFIEADISLDLHYHEQVIPADE